MKKIIIDNKYYGKIELAKTRSAYKCFVSVVKAFSYREKINLNTIYSQKKIDSFEVYQIGGCADEILELEMFIELGRILKFDTIEAKKIKEKIEFINDNAHVNLNISKNLKLFNKKEPAKTKRAYLFWDIENFSNVSPMFFDLIEPFEIEDEHIYVSCNPDSLWLFKAEWEADLYDFGKTLNSFNFTKCDHGKNVADGVLFKNFEDLKAKESNIYVITYDRELKDRFRYACHESNNLYVLERKILY